MANIQNGLNDYIRFYLTSGTQAPMLCKNVIGWNGYGLDCARNKDYHGTLITVTPTLTFTGVEKDYIKREIETNDILAEIKIVVYMLEEIDSELQWVLQETVIADISKIKETYDAIEVPFNTNDLQNSIDAYEDDEFELEKTESVDNVLLDEMQDNRIELKGRSLLAAGQSKSDMYVDNSVFLGVPFNGVWPIVWNEVSLPAERIVFSIATKQLAEGPNRQSNSKYGWFGSSNDSLDLTANYFFYDPTDTGPDANPRVKLNIRIDVNELYINNIDNFDFKLAVIKYKRVENLDLYEEVEVLPFYTYAGTPNYDVAMKKYNAILDQTYYLEVEVDWDEGLMFGAIREAGLGLSHLYVNDVDIFIDEVAFYEPSQNIKFTFYHDVIDRLLYIITSQKNKFYSSWLGRKELGYSNDGEGGLIGFLSGLWARGFTKDFDKYKSPKISLKDALESICYCFNLGAGIEVIDNKERLVVEDIKYFYQDLVVGRFPNQISNVERIFQEDDYFSSIEVGYSKFGGLDQNMGLDEPNKKSLFTTPINATSNKYSKLIKVRADEYKLESIRRKTAEKYPQEDTSGSDDNWFLDLKRSSEFEDKFEQVHWSDRLESAPTGIHDPDSFRSFWFTPIRVLLRMSSWLNSGMYKFKDKYLTLASSDGNVNLKTHFIGENSAYAENEKLQISSLKSPIHKAKVITFSHPYSKQIKDMLFGKTKIKVNGAERYVPNFYFKFEWLNEYNEVERGYFLKYTYDDNPKFEFLVANEDII